MTIVFADRARYFRALGSVIAALTLVSCTSAGASPGPLDGLRITAAHADAARVDLENIAAELGLEQAATASSQDAYLDASKAAAACVRETLLAEVGSQGYGDRVDVEVGAPALSDDGFEYSFATRLVPKEDGGIKPTPEEERLAMSGIPAVQRTCYIRNAAVAEFAYKIRLLSDEEYITGLGDSLNACLEKAGVTLDAAGGGSDVRQRLSELLAPGNGTSEGDVAIVGDCIARRPAIAFDLDASLAQLRTDIADGYSSSRQPIGMQPIGRDLDDSLK